MRYTEYRGLILVSNWVKLKYTAMNLKKLAIWKHKASLYFSIFFDFLNHSARIGKSA